VNSSVLRTLPVKFVGSLIFLIIAGIVIYLFGVLNVYIIAWVVDLITTLFG